MSDLVAEAYRTRRLEGLGDVFVCRICDTIFVSVNDALRHLQLYHKILSTVRLRQVLDEKVSCERRCSSLVESKERPLTRYVK
jgi:4-hydroxy-3-methylbut-2-en-1-yl diphosphate synthase IspG/GcpE